ncbi:MAG: hypothetical protein KKF44_06490 [Nanoarchaeota archaeon]|nr:hypothetical protein [Nanoarchaeota archaeon]
MKPHIVLFIFLIVFLSSCSAKNQCEDYRERGGPKVGCAADCCEEGRIYEELGILDCTSQEYCCDPSQCELENPCKEASEEGYDFICVTDIPGPGVDCEQASEYDCSGQNICYKCEEVHGIRVSCDEMPDTDYFEYECYPTGNPPDESCVSTMYVDCEGDAECYYCSIQTEQEKFIYPDCSTDFVIPYDDLATYESICNNIGGEFLFNERCRDSTLALCVRVPSPWEDDNMYYPCPGIDQATKGCFASYSGFTSEGDDEEERIVKKYRFITIDDMTEPGPEGTTLFDPNFANDFAKLCPDVDDTDLTKYNIKHRDLLCKDGIGAYGTCTYCSDAVNQCGDEYDCWDKDNLNNYCELMGREADTQKFTGSNDAEVACDYEGGGVCGRCKNGYTSELDKENVAETCKNDPNCIFIDDMFSCIGDCTVVGERVSHEALKKVNLLDVFQEFGQIEKGFRIVVSKAPGVTIDCQGLGIHPENEAVDAIMIIDSPSFTLEYCDIKGSIAAYDSDDLKINYNKFDLNIGEYAIRLSNSDRAKIVNNDIIAANGIRLTRSNQNLIFFNRFSMEEDGFVVDFFDSYFNVYDFNIIPEHYSDEFREGSENDKELYNEILGSGKKTKALGNLETIRLA